MHAVNLEGEPFVGQADAINKIELWHNNESFPHFLIITGEKGSGRKTLATIFAKSLDSRITLLSEVNTESVRRIVDGAYDIESKMVYIIPDADKLYASASNSLLKLTEEPPLNGYIIMTLLSLENTLATLVSRSHHIELDIYTQSELNELSENGLYSKISTNPGMLKAFERLGEITVKELIDFCEKFVSHIGTVSIVNALKSVSKLKLKESDTGFELDMFFACIRYVLNEVFETYMKGSIESGGININHLSIWYSLLSIYNYAFNRAGVNKRAVLDQFIFNIRKSLKEGVA